MMLVLSCLISTAIGFLFVTLLWPNNRNLLSNWALKLSLALGIGPGLTSCLFFLWLVFYGRADRKYIVVELLVLVALLAGCFFKRLAIKPVDSVARHRARFKYEWILLLIFIAAVCLSIFVVGTAILREPHGGWDAWAIYGVRARAIFRGGEQWRDAFTNLIAWSHPDYPLLLPASTARIWVYSGREVTSAQAILTAIFNFATLGLVCAALASLRTWAQAMLAVIVILGSTTLLTYAGSGYADIPIMFFIAATLVLFALQQQTGNYNYLILAGVTAGLAAWTKNEGWLFLLAFTVAHLLVTLRARGMRIYRREFFFLMCGMLPVMVIILSFKFALAPPNDMLTTMGGQSLTAMLLDYRRSKYIVHAFITYLFYYEGGYGGGLAYLMLLYFVCLGLARNYWRTVVLWAIMLCLVLAGFFWIYQTSRFDIVYHVRFSMDRLLLQQWPAFVFVFFLTTCAPLAGEEIHPQITQK